mgnify:CR=1 FL=1
MANSTEQSKASQIQNTLQSLAESGWIFAALTVFMETGILKLLKNKLTFNELKTATSLPEDILEQMLKLLVKTGFLINQNLSYSWSIGLLEIVDSSDLDAFFAQLRFISHMNNEFVKAASAGNLKPDWYQIDEVILHSWGKLSQFFGNNLITEDPRLVQRFLRPEARMLDAGTGTASISTQFCEIYPNLKIVAIDCSEKSLSLARENIQQHELTDRIELRNTYLQDLTDKNSYDVVWLPQVYYSDTEYLKCLQIIWQALKPSGMIYVGALSSDDDNLSNTVSQFTNATYGSLRYVKDVIASFEKVGFVDVQSFDGTSGQKSFNGYSLVSAIKPSI